MKRRDFLRDAAVLAVVSGSPLLHGCEAYSRIDQDDASAISPVSGRVGSRLAEALRLAALAPSMHNTQPWVVRIESRNDWVLGSDPGRWLPEVDPFNRGTLIAIGAFLENLIQVCRDWGQAVEYRVMATDARQTDLVQLRLRPAPALAQGIEAVRLRRTLRSRFSQEVLRRDDLDFAAGDPEHLHYFPADSAGGRRLSEATIEATQAQTARDEAQAELAQWIRWSDDDARRHLDGLTPASLELDRATSWFVRQFFSAKDVMKPSFRSRRVGDTAEQVRNCGGWMVLTADSQEVDAVIEAGRRFERFFLRARGRRIGVHPMTQVLEEQPWQPRIGHELGLYRPALAVMRVGYREPYALPVSVRRPLDSFVRA